MNDASRRRLTKVHPELATRITTLLDILTQHGLTVEVVQGLRTFAEQDALFAQGRSRPGPVVTRARGGQSNHNYGLAVDMVPFNNGQPNWNAPLGVWTTIGTEAEKLGLEWGGDWKKFVDKPHVQLPGLSVGECFSLFKRGGLDAVWAESTRRLGVAPTHCACTTGSARARARRLDRNIIGSSGLTSGSTRRCRARFAGGARGGRLFSRWFSRRHFRSGHAQSRQEVSAEQGTRRGRRGRPRNLGRSTGHAQGDEGNAARGGQADRQGYG